MKKLDFAQSVGLLANLGVIAGILFLVIEIRQNNSLLAAQASYAKFNVERERRARIVDNRAGLADIVERAIAGEELTPTETLRLDAYWRDVLDSWQWQFRESQAGRLQSGIIDFDSWRSLWEPDFGLQRNYSETVDRRDADFVRFFEENVINQR